MIITARTGPGRPGARNFLFVSHVSAEVQGLDLLPLLFRRLEVEQPKLELVSIWDAGVSVNGLYCYATVLPPNCLVKFIIKRPKIFEHHVFCLYWVLIKLSTNFCLKL